MPLKGKFVPPGKKNANKDAPSSTTQQQQQPKPLSKPVQQSTPIQQQQSKPEEKNNAMQEEPKKVETTTQKPQNSLQANRKPLTLGKKPFKPPGQKGLAVTSTKTQGKQQEAKQAEAPKPNESDRYYKCFYSKDIKKKNKSFSDGIMICIGFKLKLFDMQGTQVMTGTKSRIQRDDPANPNEFTLGLYFIQYEHLMDKEDVQKEVNIPDQEFYDDKQLKLMQEAQKKAELSSKGISMVIDGVDISTYEYYKCFYTKNINKKHKVWNDGFVAYETKKIVIYEESGSKVYDTYKSKGFQTENDNEYVFGSYIIQQEQKVKNEDFISGRCFIQHVELQKKALPTLQKKKPAKQFKLQGQKEELTVEQKIEDKIKEIPEGTKMLTDINSRDYYPVYVDKFLAQYLRPHQHVGVKFMFECISGFRGGTVSGCILADSMGLGKTLQAITITYVALKRSPHSSIKPLAEKVIIVSPLTLVNNWNNEFKKWIQGTKLVPLCAMGSPDNISNTVKSFVEAQYRVLLISYEQFQKHIDKLKNKCDLLIFDEGHKLKNDKMKQYREIQKFPCKKRIILTGTPLQNRLEEFYSCVSLVNPNVFSSLQKFKSVFADPIEAGIKSDASEIVKFRAKERSKELIKIISSFILRRKADVLEKLLPPRVEYFIFLKLSSIQKHVYNEIVKSKQLMKGGGGNQGDIFGLMIIMRKLLNHPMLVQTDQNKTAQDVKPLLNHPKYLKDNPDFQVGDWNNSSKFMFIIEILNKLKEINENSNTKENEKVIIVSQWTQTLDLVEKLIVELGFQFVKLDGSVSGNKRQALIDRFQDRESNIIVFLLCAKAGGVGLNLTAANRMIMMDVDWNPAVDQQVMGRVWRDGQNRTVHIYRLFSIGTMEEKVLQRQFLKETMAMNIVDNSKNNKSFDKDDLRKLFIHEEDTCITFNKKENELPSFQDVSPDYDKNMQNYIGFIKQNIRDKKSDNKDEPDEGVNEFEKDDVFLNKDEGEEEIQDEEDDEEKFQTVEQKKKKKGQNSSDSLNGDDNNGMEEEEVQEDNDSTTSSKGEQQNNSKKPQKNVKRKMEIGEKEIPILKKLKKPNTQV